MSEHDDEPETATAPAPVGDDPGLVADRYRILRTLGKGGGGHVWLANDEKLGRQIALKRVGGDADADKLVTRGYREARTTATLAHENVVRVYDAFEFEGSPWIVMEYVPGPSLASLLEGGKRLPAEQVAVIGQQVATALAAAHGAGILHRDVKPANVLLTDERGRNAKLTDFGIARAEGDHQLTQTGFVSGTAAYFSPELARGEDPSPASDVWALGATLYAAVEGRRPFPDQPNAVAQLHTIVREQPVRPQHAGPLEPVLAGMLDTAPGRRWDAERVARELDAIVRGGTAGAGGTGAAARAGAGGAGDADADATRSVPPVDPTQSIPVGHAAPQQGRPAQGAPPRAVRETTYHRPENPRRRAPRRGVLLGWLVAVPLLAVLVWLGWSIATGNLPGLSDGTGATSEAPQTGPVTAQEAEGVSREFYTRLQEEGLESARELTTPEAFIDPGITDGLTDLQVSDVAATEQQDGTAVVTAVASYSYGTNTIVQDETLQVSRSTASPGSWCAARSAGPAAAPSPTATRLTATRLTALAPVRVAATTARAATVAAAVRGTTAPATGAMGTGTAPTTATGMATATTAAATGTATAASDGGSGVDGDASTDGR